MILKKRISRIIAFILSCALIGVCAFQGAFIINENISASSERQQRDDVIGSYSYSDKLYSFYDRLWALSSIYLRYTDKNGKYTGSEFFQKSVKKALFDLGLMDEKGKLILDVPEGFDYYASCGDNVLTNTKSAPAELAGDYSVEYVNGKQHNFPMMVYYHYTNEHSWYTTNYGMTYIYTNGYLPKNAVVLYDFDTEGLDSYRDDNGVQVYYKTDGTTPVPDKMRYDNNPNIEASRANREALEQSDYDRDSVYYVLPEERLDGHDEISVSVEEHTVENVRDMSDVTDTNAYMFFDENSRSWYKVNKSEFQRYDGDNSDITIYIKPTDELIAEYEQYNAAREKLENDSVHRMMRLLPVGIAGCIIALILLFCCGYSVEKKRFVLSSPDYIFAELPIVLIIGSLAAVYAFCESGAWDMTNEFKRYYNFDMAGIIEGSGMMVLYAICLGSLITIVTRLKCRSFWRTTLVGRILSFIYRRFIKKTVSYIKNKHDSHSKKHLEKLALSKDIFLRRFIIRTIAALAVGFFMTVMAISAREAEIAVFGSIPLIILYGVFSIRDYKEIAGVAKQISDMNGGDYSPRTVPEKSPAYGMTNNLNNISDGIRTAVDRQVQSERMKVELVTNVSHDLKTPLTSIISYIDLLSNEDMSPAARDYVSIISQKSERLKIMVSDLFDLAKAASRTDVNSENIDAVILTQQVLGDMADRIAQSGMEVRTDIKAQAAPIMAEGKKLYRVFQNLIDNALKYSMAGTRIYVSLENSNGYTDISVKNISAEEMDFTPEEITERFARGDRSRTTEGNGLGLSIAKSFTEACGGQFEIIIDGDMFTAHVKLPLIEK